MAFSGGTYDEVARWLRNFLTSHAKREHPRIEVRLEHGDERAGHSYAAQLTLGDRRGPVLEFDYQDVAEHRGNLAWCRDLADRTRQLAREHLLTPSTSGAR